MNKKSMEFWKPKLRTEPRLGASPTLLTKFSKLFQLLLVLFLVITFIINVMFILKTGEHLQKEDSIEINYDLDYSFVERRERKHMYKRTEDGALKTLTIEVLSSQSRLSVSVDDDIILENSEERGIHVFILNQASGSVMAQRIFNSHDYEGMDLFLNMVSDGRIVIIAIKDDVTFQMELPARDLLVRLGLGAAQVISYQEMWAMVAQKGVKMFGESYSKTTDFSASVVLKVEVPLQTTEVSKCKWPDSEENKRRKEFCSRFEGYGSVCSCTVPAQLVFNPQPIANSRVSNVPVAVIASNRPHYLYRMLQSLLSARGANRDMITVFIDGYFEEPLEVTKLFGLRAIQHLPIGKKNARITQHYKASLTATFNMFPTAMHAIILEEDLDVSEDLFSFFNQTIDLMELDPTIYCISAWNDQGFEHTSSNASILYRVETMPGLGWILKRSLYKDELEPRWPSPEKIWDWDMWMRMPEVSKGRECVIPEVSRTYHFGLSGSNMNPKFHDKYFKTKRFNAQPSVHLLNVNSLIKNNYESMLTQMMKSGVLLDHSKSPCEDDFFPHRPDEVLLMFIKMEESDDFVTWLQVAKCLKIWDLDARGQHKGMWRLRIKGSDTFIIGVPYSEYSRFKPDNITPIIIEPPT